MSSRGADSHTAPRSGVVAWALWDCGNLLLDKVTMPAPYKARIASLRRLIEALDFEIGLFTNVVGGRLAHDPGYTAIQQIPGIGPVLAAVFVAEIGDVHRFPGPAQLTCWAGLTPSHHESDTTVRRGRITKQGSRLVRWAAIESVQILPKTSHIGGIREKVAPPARQPQHRRRGRGPKTARTRLLRATGSPRPGPAPLAARGVSTQFTVGADRAGHDPRNRRGRSL
jgi:Transposase IS116/IS110/IS902 family